MTLAVRRKRVAQYVRCASCRVEWVAFFAPASIEEVLRMMDGRTHCPECGGREAVQINRGGRRSGYLRRMTDRLARLKGAK